MSLAILEINDWQISLSNGDTTIVSNGFCLNDNQQLHFGETALAQLKTKPLQVFSHYWNQLSLEPVRISQPNFKHHADLVYHQLQDLFKQHAEVDEVVVVVPDNFTQAQLALLLGVLSHCSVTVVALVSTALAACYQRSSNSDVIYLDCHAHFMLLTHLQFGEKITVGHHQVIPGCGWLDWLQTWQKMLVAEFVRQHRFDPTHKAEHEQQLFDQLRRQNFQTGANSFKFEIAGNSIIVSKDDLQLASAIMWQKIDNARDSFAANQVVINQQLLAIPGLQEKFAVTSSVNHHAIADAARTLFNKQAKTDAGVQLIQAAHRSQTAKPVPVQTQANALLIGDVAYKLDSGHYLLEAKNERLKLTVAPSSSGNSLANIKVLANEIVFEPTASSGCQIDNVVVAQATTLQSGQRINFNNQLSCNAIRVLTGAETHG